MKYVLILIAVFLGVGIVGCDDDDKGKLNPNASIYINGYKSSNRALTETKQKMSVHEILLSDTLFLDMRDLSDIVSSGKVFAINRGENDGWGRIDTVHDRLVFHAGNLTTIDDNQFLLLDRCVIVSYNTWDTLAYVPYAQRYEAYLKIKALWDSENWSEMYKIFEDAFTFYPCTGAEYDSLLHIGQQ